MSKLWNRCERRVSGLDVSSEPTTEPTTTTTSPTTIIGRIVNGVLYFDIPAGGLEGTSLIQLSQPPATELTGQILTSGPADSIPHLSTVYTIPQTGSCSSASAPAASEVNVDYVNENVTTPDSKIINNVINYLKMCADDRTSFQGKIDEVNNIVQQLQHEKAQLITERDALAAELAKSRKDFSILEAYSNQNTRDINHLQREYNSLLQSHEAIIHVIGIMRNMTPQVEASAQPSAQPSVQPSLQPNVFGV